MRKILYDSIKKALIDVETGECLHQEDAKGEISIVDIVADGRATWENGEPYTLADFCKFVLNLGIEG